MGRFTPTFLTLTTPPAPRPPSLSPSFTLYVPARASSRVYDIPTCSSLSSRVGTSCAVCQARDSNLPICVLSLHRLVLPQTDLQLNGGQLRVTWQFYEEAFMWRDASRGRNFSTDRTYFDHYILAPSQVCRCNSWVYAVFAHVVAQAFAKRPVCAGCAG